MSLGEAGITLPSPASPLLGPHVPKYLSYQMAISLCLRGP